MSLKISDALVLQAKVGRVQAYLLSKALRKELCSDDEVKQVYKLTDEEFTLISAELVHSGAVEITIDKS